MRSLFLFLFLIPFGSMAQTDLYTKLVEVNAYWEQQTDIDQTQLQNTVFSGSELDAIQIHLKWVEYTLRQRSVTHLNEAQRQSRAQLLDELHGYWQAGQFPVNDQAPERTPVFIDRYGTHCAVGYLMMKSGHEDLAQSIHQTQNLAYVRDIRADGLGAWQQASGFSSAELAWIQPGYPPTTDVREVTGGTSDSVHCLLPYQGSMIVGGSFTQVGTSGLSAPGIAMWTPQGSGGNWSTLNDVSMIGTFVDVAAHDSGLFACGSFFFQMQPGPYHLAQYANGQWSPMAAPPGKINSVAYFNEHLYIAGSLDLGMGSDSHIVAVWDGGSWQNASSNLFGEAYNLVPMGDSLFVCGDFIWHWALDISNIAVLDTNGQAGPVGNNIRTPVYDVVKFRDTLYAGGDFWSAQDSNYLGGLMRLAGNQWELAYDTSYYLPQDFEAVEIHDMQVMGDSALLFAGPISLYSTSGGILERYHPTRWSGGLMSDGIVTTNRAITVLSAMQDEVFLGGAFQTATVSSSGFGSPPVEVTLNHLGRTNLGPFVITSVDEVTSEQAHWQVYPNPTTSRLELGENWEELAEVQVYAMDGSWVRAFAPQRILDVSELPVGTYVLELKDREGSLFREKVVVH